MGEIIIIGDVFKIVAHQYLFFLNGSLHTPIDFYEFG
jgi:hypothetical protein